MMVNKDGSGEDDDSRDISEVESRGWGVDEWKDG